MKRDTTGSGMFLRFIHEMRTQRKARREWLLHDLPILLAASLPIIILLYSGLVRLFS